MALAVGDLVYLDAGDDLQQDSPLFGTVDIINGDAPDQYRINWENGIQEFFSATATAKLVEIAVDPSADQFVGRWVLSPMAGGSQVMRSFLAVDSGNARTFLIRTQQGYYFVGRFLLTYPTKATSLEGDGEPV